MNSNAAKDINSIDSKGNGNNNLINPVINNHYFDKPNENTQQTVQFKVKSFIEGNMQIAQTLKKSMGMPMVERFDIYKAQILEEEVLHSLPDIYHTFHKLRLALEKGNRIIETATSIYNNPNEPNFPGNGRIHAVSHFLDELRLHIDHEIVVLCQNMLRNQNVLSKDEMMTIIIGNPFPPIPDKF